MATITRLTAPESALPADREAKIRSAAELLEGLPKVDRPTLARLVRGDPAMVPVLGLVLGLSQEQLRNHLRYRTGSSAWTTLAQRDPDRLIEVLSELQLLKQLEVQRRGSYTFADVLIARAGSRERAGRAIGRGRQLEDIVESLIRSLGLPYRSRTRFVGTRGEDAPCDFAIPDGEHARIVVAVKGFDSTGSKLSAAVDEIDLMARKRRPAQFVYAVVDGIGWLNRQADLRRIFALFESSAIDGLYSLARVADLERDLRDAARRSQIPRGRR